MSYTPKPTYVVSFRGKNGSMGFVRTDDVEETKKLIKREGHKIVDTTLDKRASFDDLLTKAASMNNDVALYAQEQLREREAQRVAKSGDDVFRQDEAAKTVYKNSTGSLNHPINTMRDAFPTVSPQAQEDARKAAEEDILHIHLPIQDDGNDDDSKDEDNADDDSKDDASDEAEDFATNYARAFAEQKARERAAARSKSR